MERVRIEGQLLRHEADLDHGADTILQQAIVDLIDIGKIVDRVTVLVLAINPDLVMKNGMKANVLEICYLFYRTQVVTVAIAQGEDCASRTKHLLPEMRKGRGLRAGIDWNLLLRLRGRHAGHAAKKQQGSSHGY